MPILPVDFIISVLSNDDKNANGGNSFRIPFISDWFDKLGETVDLVTKIVLIFIILIVIIIIVGIIYFVYRMLKK